MEEQLAAFGRLLKIMDDLRAGCPWDKKQTLESLRYLTIEETYELSDAILEKDMNGIKKELGDLMLHLVFYAKIGSETGDFDIKDVLDSISEKLIERHPHIYGEVKVANAEDVRMQEKARGVGFDWENATQVWEKVNEEIQELQEEVKSNDHERMEKEFGDLLFSLINYARFIGVNPEDALERTNKKFIQRFRFIEEQTNKQGKHLKELTLKEMDAFWDEAKKSE